MEVVECLLPEGCLAEACCDWLFLSDAGLSFVGMVGLSDRSRRRTAIEFVGILRPASMALLLLHRGLFCRSDNDSPTMIATSDLSLSLCCIGDGN
jgi:hypothetical protein